LATRLLITTLRALKADLAEARSHGFALSYAEHELGVGTVAAPLG
jgi:DNA-binding IclR family transcriptional regulator